MLCGVLKYLINLIKKKKWNYWPWESHKNRANKKKHLQVITRPSIMDTYPHPTSNVKTLGQISIYTCKKVTFKHKNNVIHWIKGSVPDLGQTNKCGGVKHVWVSYDRDIRYINYQLSLTAIRTIFGRFIFKLLHMLMQMFNFGNYSLLIFIEFNNSPKWL